MFVSGEEPGVKHDVDEEKEDEEREEVEEKEDEEAERHISSSMHPLPLSSPPSSSPNILVLQGCPQGAPRGPPKGARGRAW